MRVAGVGEFVSRMGDYIQGANRLNQKILITRKGRFYFVVTPFRKLDEDGRREVREVLSVSRKRKLKRKLLIKTRLVRMKKIHT